jgi:hypothetical protein
VIKSCGRILTVLQVFGMAAQWRIEYPEQDAADF